MKIVKYVLIGIVVLLLGGQAIRPAKTNPPASRPYEIGDAHVESILRRACFDCHSNETRWPWYSEIAPMSWQIVRHVDDGRRHMNFSDWNEEKAKKRLEEMCEEIEKGGMPIPGYVLLHRDAKLSPEDVSALCSWSGARLAMSAR
jgi:hypothetical protein